MQRNLRSVRRGIDKSSRRFKEFNLTPRATRSPYPSDKALDETYCSTSRGTARFVSAKSSKDSRAVTMWENIEERVMRRSTKCYTDHFTRLANGHIGELLADDTFLDDDVTSLSPLKPFMRW